MILNNEKHRHKELADFLKTRRAKILPSQVAGISMTWYTWLEQGRPIQVSTQVIETPSKILGSLTVSRSYESSQE